jgi:hypothetical protein
MPCYRCNNGKYKYGQRGKCQFDTLEACKAAEAAIHAKKRDKATGSAPKPQNKSN